MLKTFHITTYGCQANLADSQKMAGVLERYGMENTSSEESADVLIFNTCSVKQKAEDRVFGLNKYFRGLKSKNKKMKIVLAGCMLHYSQAELKKRLPDIDIFLKNLDTKKLPKLLGLKKTKATHLSAYTNSESALVPITYGCNNFCSYCIVPFSRGREISRPAKDIIKDVKKALQEGKKEIWLLGQNVNSYKDKETNFAKLLRLVNSVPGDFWVRFTSPHPKDFSDNLIKSMTECTKFPHYLNLPVQSGNNEVLKRMNRPYAVEHYKKLVGKIRKAMPNVALSTDIIVGFPGETRKQFLDTAKLMKEVKFDMAFLSEYSPRSKTLAAERYKDNVPNAEKEKRKNELNEILKKTSYEFNKNLVGKTVTVLNGRTEHNKQIQLDKEYPKNTFVKALVTHASVWSLRGRLL